MADPAAEISRAQEQIIEEFSNLEQWEDRYRRIIELGRSLPAIEELPAEARDEKFRVRGCQSTVYLKPELRQGRVRFVATSDALIVRGLIALLLRIYSDRTPAEILGARPEFIERLGLGAHLSQGRANGLAAMIEQIKLYGLAFQKLAAAQGGGRS